jgi:hypothetical protein
MVFLKQWRKRSTVSFIRTASLTVLLFFSPVSMAVADCDGNIYALESMMQDGLGDLTTAQNLTEEALHRSDITDGQACSFLHTGVQRFDKAKAHFQNCVDSLEDMLTRCKAPDWLQISASPDLCQTRITEIERELALMPHRLTRFCDQ